VVVAQATNLEIGVPVVAASTTPVAPAAVASPAAPTDPAVWLRTLPVAARRESAECHNMMSVDEVGGMLSLVRVYRDVCDHFLLALLSRSIVCSHHLGHPRAVVGQFAEARPG
jgi:hypothetical protein